MDHDWKDLLNRPRTVRFVQHSARRVARRIAENQGRAARRMETLQHLQGRNLKAGDFVEQKPDGEGEGKNYVAVSQDAAFDGAIDEKAVLQNELERLYDALRLRYDMVLSLFEEYASAMPDEDHARPRGRAAKQKKPNSVLDENHNLALHIDRVHLFAFIEFCGELLLFCCFTPFHLSHD